MDNPKPSAFIPHPLSFPLRLSQGQLNLLSTCPRKFQHTYLEQLASPITPEQQERLASGARFHLLMQQWQLGLPVEPLVQEDAQIQRWFTAFINAAPQILSIPAPGGNESRQSEFSLTIEFEGYLLTVIYDLLITSQQQAKILDWKTYPRPQNPRWLLQNWQTRLYPFVLAEAGIYLPAQISMTYWFFQAEGTTPTQPQSFTIDYDADKHKQNRQDLKTLLHQLTQWLEQYQQGEPFPQVAPGASECEVCAYGVRCDRAPLQPHNSFTATTSTETLTRPNLTDIQEIPL